MTMTTDDARALVAKAREIDNTATRKAWAYIGGTGVLPGSVQSDGANVVAMLVTAANGAFIAESRALVPQLADALEQAQAVCEAQGELIAAYEARDMAWSGSVALAIAREMISRPQLKQAQQRIEAARERLAAAKAKGGENETASRNL